jgi:hypothetical protein
MSLCHLGSCARAPRTVSVVLEADSDGCLPHRPVGMWSFGPLQELNAAHCRRGVGKAFQQGLAAMTSDAEAAQWWEHLLAMTCDPQLLQQCLTYCRQHKDTAQLVSLGVRATVSLAYLDGLDDQPDKEGVGSAARLVGAECKRTGAGLVAYVLLCKEFPACMLRADQTCSPPAGATNSRGLAL